MIRILITVSDSEQFDLIEGILVARMPDVQIDRVEDEKRAKARIGSREYQLVIAHQHLARDSNTPIQEGEARGLLLAQWLDANANRIPVILLTFQSDKEVIAATNRLPKCEAVFIGLDRWEDSLIKRVDQGLALQRTGQPQEDSKRLEVDIYIDPVNNWADADMRGVNFACCIEKERLKIQGSAILKLSMKAAEAVDRTIGGEKWHRRLQTLGQALMRHIFRENSEFYRKFERLVEKVGGLQNTRIRFIVEEEIHAVALEAIFGPHELQSSEDYWMLHAPIYRSLRACPGYTYPLFHEDDHAMKGRDINVLIIESPAEGIVTLNGFEKLMDPLNNLVRECDFVEEYFHRVKDAGNVHIGAIKRVSAEIPEASMLQALRKAFGKDNPHWHIVHYAGHSYFDPATKEGFVFFPGAGDRIDIVKADEFSAWLRSADTRFIFLSSCHSSEAGFVLTMAKKGIPAIVGFRWDIEDDMAVAYTGMFYRELFEGDDRCLERAFLKARKGIYEDNPLNPIWAAPVLVIQIPP
jgi:hypothetical protein